SGKTVFITGATGFMGKVLLEKLIRSVPDIKKIYILLRPKKGDNPELRVKQLADGPIFTFNNLNAKPNEKIEAICGDITKEGFDMSINDREKLIDEVSVVFHFAASVRMDLSLKEAVITNTKSTYELFKFCMNLKNLQSVIHLSTAYCNVEIENMEEKVYPIDVDPYKIIDMVEWMDEKCLNAITKRLLGPHPNTYTFTKRLAEIIAVDMADKVPLIIPRPSIVVPSLSEPMPGWVDNFYGPMGIFLAGGIGILKSCLLDGEAIPEVIPVDFAINSVICCGYERLNKYFCNYLINLKFLSSSKRIDLILGVSLYSEILQNGVKRSSDGSLIVQQTAFGWILSGVLSNQSQSNFNPYVFQCSIDREFARLMQKFWTIEEKSSFKPCLSTDEIDCEKHFVNSHLRDSSGRFTVRLPFRKFRFFLVPS
ncbi:fatty acyl-CoA reductase 1-like, partial [Onthophagus taurus]|uniref:fatty acyl-CoA reductase 1-like n=1 Tax=Onthophagus taurus TaxID=166361 RepID=UPI0039BE3F56